MSKIKAFLSVVVEVLALLGIFFVFIIAFFGWVCCLTLLILAMCGVLSWTIVGLAVLIWLVFALIAAALVNEQNFDSEEDDFL